MAGLLADTHGRTIDYLRVSVNRTCNYACIHCDMEGDARTGPGTVLTPADVSAIVGAFMMAGPIKKVKITGGEPLLHPDIVAIIQAIRAIPGIEDISLTTNGFRLATLAAPLKAAGLDRVNVSLCSLDETTYTRITGVDGLARALAGIEAASKAGLSPVKINLVLLKGINDGELGAFVRFAGEHRARLQLIELHGIDGIHDGTRHEFISRHAIDVDAALRGVDLPVIKVEHRSMQHRKIVHFGNGASVETVRLSPSFCEKCTKLRVTAAGTLKPCLMRPGLEVPLLDVIRGARAAPGGDTAVLDAVASAVNGRHPYASREDGGVPAR